jgi:hypothetical protein
MSFRCTTVLNSKIALKSFRRKIIYLSTESYSKLFNVYRVKLNNLQGNSWDIPNQFSEVIKPLTSILIHFIICSASRSSQLCVFASSQLCAFATLRLCVFASSQLCTFAPLRLHSFASLRLCVVGPLIRHSFASLGLCVFATLHLCVFTALRRCVFASLRL